MEKEKDTAVLVKLPAVVLTKTIRRLKPFVPKKSETSIKECGFLHCEISGKNLSLIATNMEVFAIADIALTEGYDGDDTIKFYLEVEVLKVLKPGTVYISVYEQRVSIHNGVGIIYGFEYGLFNAIAIDKAFLGRVTASRVLERSVEVTKEMVSEWKGQLGILKYDNFREFTRNFCIEYRGRLSSTTTDAHKLRTYDFEPETVPRDKNNLVGVVRIPDKVISTMSEGGKLNIYKYLEGEVVIGKYSYEESIYGRFSVVSTEDYEHVKGGTTGSYYPYFPSVIPDESMANVKLTVPVAALCKNLKELINYAPKETKQVKFTIPVSGDDVVIGASCVEKNTECSMRLLAEIENLSPRETDFVIAFNASFLLLSLDFDDFRKAGRVSLEFSTNQRGVAIRSAKGVSLIMPLYISD